MNWDVFAFGLKRGKDGTKPFLIPSTGASPHTLYAHHPTTGHGCLSLKEGTVALKTFQRPFKTSEYSRDTAEIKSDTHTGLSIMPHSISMGTVWILKHTDMCHYSGHFLTNAFESSCRDLSETFFQQNLLKRWVGVIYEYSYCICADFGMGNTGNMVEGLVSSTWDT